MPSFHHPDELKLYELQTELNIRSLKIHLTVFEGKRVRDLLKVGQILADNGNIKLMYMLSIHQPILIFDSRRFIL